MKPGYTRLMIINNGLVLLTIVVCLGACASQSSPSARAINKQCTLEMETARTAIHLRDKGRDKDSMMQTLPPLKSDSTRLLQQMHVIVQETFAFPSLNDVVYPTYRFEYCVRQMQHKPVPTNLQAVAAQLLACQAQFGSQPSKPATECILASFPSEPVPMQTQR